MLQSNATGQSYPVDLRVEDPEDRTLLNGNVDSAEGEESGNRSHWLNMSRDEVIRSMPLPQSTMDEGVYIA